MLKQRGFLTTMAGNGSFDERIQYLDDEVGFGDLVMGCSVDQPYAQDQHETLHYRHRNGGRAKYLGGPLFENANDLMAKLAHGAITEYGSNLTDTAKEIADTLEGYVAENAPIDTGRLSLSGSPYVKSDGVLIYHRPPLAPRRRDGEEHGNGE